MLTVHDLLFAPISFSAVKTSIFRPVLILTVHDLLFALIYFSAVKTSVFRPVRQQPGAREHAAVLAAHIHPAIKGHNSTPPASVLPD